MSELLRMTVGASIVLDNIIDRLMFIDGNEERNLPFSIKYKLRRNKNLTEKDFLFFEEKRRELIKKYGKEEEGKVKVTDENLSDFTEELTQIRKVEVSHDFLKFKPEELEDLRVTGFTADEIGLFMLAMVEDPTMVEDLKNPIEKGDN